MVASVVTPRKTSAHMPADEGAKPTINAIESQQMAAVTPASRALVKCLLMVAPRGNRMLCTTEHNPLCDRVNHPHRSYTRRMRHHGPDPETASQLLAETEEILERQRGAGRAAFTGRPLIAWGIAWLVAYPGFDFLSGAAAMGVTILVVIVASVVSWVPHDRGLRTGFESRIRLGWLAILGASPFLVATVAPVELVPYMLLLGALWSLGMALTGIALRDRALTVVTLLMVALAGLARQQHFAPPMTLYGLTAGLLLVSLGSVRLRRGRPATVLASRGRA